MHRNRTNSKSFESSPFNSMRRRMVSIGLVCVSLVAALAQFGCAFQAQVSGVNAATIPTRQFTGVMSAVVEGITDAETCSESQALYDFCVTGTHSAISTSLSQMLGSYGFSAGPGGYRAILRIDDLTHGLDNDMAKMWVDWQFVLFDPSGAVVLQIAERTESGPITGRGDYRAAVRRMFVSVVNRIAVGLNGGAATAPAVATTP